MMMLAKFNPQGLALRSETRLARRLRGQRRRGQTNERAPSKERIRSFPAPAPFATPALELHASTQERRRSAPRSKAQEAIKMTRTAGLAILTASALVLTGCLQHTFSIGTGAPEGALV